MGKNKNKKKQDEIINEIKEKRKEKINKRKKERELKKKKEIQKNIDDGITKTYGDLIVISDKIEKIDTGHGVKDEFELLDYDDISDMDDFFDFTQKQYDRNKKFLEKNKNYRLDERWLKERVLKQKSLRGTIYENEVFVSMGVDIDDLNNIISTASHDIPSLVRWNKEKDNLLIKNRKLKGNGVYNIDNNNENLGVKSTGDGSIAMGDMMRFATEYNSINDNEIFSEIIIFLNETGKVKGHHNKSVIESWTIKDVVKIDLKIKRNIVNTIITKSKEDYNRLTDEEKKNINEYNNLFNNLVRDEDKKNSRTKILKKFNEEYKKNDFTNLNNFIKIATPPQLKKLVTTIKNKDKKNNLIYWDGKNKNKALNERQKILNSYGLGIISIAPKIASEYTKSRIQTALTMNNIVKAEKKLKDLKNSEKKGDKETYDLLTKGLNDDKIIIKTTNKKHIPNDGNDTTRLYKFVDLGNQGKMVEIFNNKPFFINDTYEYIPKRGKHIPINNNNNSFNRKIQNILPNNKIKLAYNSVYEKKIEKYLKRHNKTSYQLNEKDKTRIMNNTKITLRKQFKKEKNIFTNINLKELENSAFSSFQTNIEKNNILNDIIDNYAKEVKRDIGENDEKEINRRYNDKLKKLGLL